MSFTIPDCHHSLTQSFLQIIHIQNIILIWWHRNTGSSRSVNWPMYEQVCVSTFTEERSHTNMFSLPGSECDWAWCVQWVAGTCSVHTNHLTQAMHHSSTGHRYLVYYDGMGRSHCCLEKLIWMVTRGTPLHAKQDYYFFSHLTHLFPGPIMIRLIDVSLLQFPKTIFLFISIHIHSILTIRQTNSKRK